jgi:hypothetical protein
MRAVRTILAGVLLASGQAQASAPGDEDWQLFGRVLSLVQSVVHGAAQSNDPRALEKGVDHLFSGEHREANNLAADLLGEAFDEMPSQYKGAALALAKDLATIARKERARQGALAGPSTSAAPDAALQARKDLTAMGLRYFDPAQFLEAVKRNDALAVELFIVARGVELSARDGEGLTAMALAQRQGNGRLVDLLASASR